MSFRIPSLDEARRRQERQSAEVLSPELPLGRRRPTAAAEKSSSAASSSSAPRAAAAAAAPANPYARRNPYLKRPRDAGGGGGGGDGSKGSAPKSSSSSPPSKRPSSSSAAAAASRPANPYGQGRTGRGRNVPSGGAPAKPPLPPRPPSPPEDPSLDAVGAGATFSQAFGSVEDSSPYRREAAALAAGGGSSVRAEDDEEGRKLRAEQRSFDASLAAETSGGASGEGSSETGDSANRPKDDRTVLQPHVLHVSHRQRGNPLLRLIRNVPWEHARIIPDYILGSNRCALFLSVKYHNLHPNYVHRRIAELGRDFDLRVLLVKVDVEDNASTLLSLNKIAVVNDLTLILAWSDEECARYLETYKAFEGKDASSIQKREQTTYADRVTDVLCTVRSVNKTDAAQLLGQFGSLRALVAASADELSLCPGIGEKKVRRLWEAFHKPFSTAAMRKKRRLKREAAEVDEKRRLAEEKGVGEQDEGDGDGDDAVVDDDDAAKEDGKEEVTRSDTDKNDKSDKTTGASDASDELGSGPKSETSKEGD